ncbi:hypothetical protein GRI75_10430 [Altererythrobacter soli]|uniref:Uncharacterized protein n=1 Tax=Croceibacterium soli TaxID=1739690 RepID=A0A6I4UU67_9SPHN|nr:hypothetical protein [Croceibacterium soli]MXP42056.1 hypothetical protein [Croceibacterium soli]
MLTIAFTNSAAVASALCGHADALAHAAALASSNAEAAAQARGEDHAAAKVSQDSTLVDAASSQLASFTMPRAATIEAPENPGRANPRLRNDAALFGRAISPLLEPPLA